MGSVHSVGPAFFPLDEHLAVLPGKLTPQLQGWLTRLGAWMPFPRAADLLADLTQVRVSAATARRATEAAGAVYSVYQTHEAAQILQHDPVAPVAPDRVVVSVDGAMVPLRGGEWAEVKTLALGEPTPMADEGVHVGALSYFSRLADAERFGHRALGEVHRRGVLAAGAVAAVTDGAEWIQGFVDLHCPDALRILDFAHAAQRLAAIGQAVWGEGQAQAQQCTMQQCHALKHLGPGPVLADVLQQQVAAPTNDVLTSNLTYLTKRVGQLQYPTFQARGWPIGSGMVESANNLVVEARLKGSGMHWARDNVNALLALRTVVCNDRWTEGWAQMQARRRRVVGAQRQARRQREAAAIQATWIAQARASVAARPRTTIPGTARPTPDHPWKRPFSPRARTCSRTNPAAKKL
jgi:hypothetical protein